VVQLDLRVDLAADAAELVQIPVARVAPAAKLDPKLEGRVGSLHERALVEPDGPVEVLDRRDRRLAHADGPDGLAFDQRDFGSARQRGRQHRRRHPARGTAADHQDRSHAVRTGIPRHGVSNPHARSMTHCRALATPACAAHRAMPPPPGDERDGG
jgi:hypothetical protein